MQVLQAVEQKRLQHAVIPKKKDYVLLPGKAELMTNWWFNEFS